MWKLDARGYNEAEARKTKVHNTQNGPSISFAEHDALQQNWCAHNDAVRKVGVSSVGFSLGSLMSMGSPAVSTQATSYGIRRLPKPFPNSLQASFQPCFNSLGSRLLRVHVDKDLQHWFRCYSSRSMHEREDLYYNVPGRLSISDAA